MTDISVSMHHPFGMSSHVNNFKFAESVQIINTTRNICYFEMSSFDHMDHEHLCTDYFIQSSDEGALSNINSSFALLFIS